MSFHVCFELVLVILFCSLAEKNHSWFLSVHIFLEDFRLVKIFCEDIFRQKGLFAVFVIFLCQNKSKCCFNPTTNPKKNAIFSLFLDWMIFEFLLLFCWVKSFLGAEISSQKQKQAFNWPQKKQKQSKKKKQKQTRKRQKQSAFFFPPFWVENCLLSLLFVSCLFFDSFGDVWACYLSEKISWSKNILTDWSLVFCHKPISFIGCLLFELMRAACNNTVVKLCGGSLIRVGHLLHQMILNGLKPSTTFAKTRQVFLQTQEEDCVLGSIDFGPLNPERLKLELEDCHFGSMIGKFPGMRQANSFCGDHSEIVFDSCFDSSLVHWPTRILFWCCEWWILLELGHCPPSVYCLEISTTRGSLVLQSGFGDAVSVINISNMTQQYRSSWNAFENKDFISQMAIKVGLMKEEELLRALCCLMHFFWRSFNNQSVVWQSHGSCPPEDNRTRVQSIVNHIGTDRKGKQWS